MNFSLNNLESGNECFHENFTGVFYHIGAEGAENKQK